MTQYAYSIIQHTDYEDKEYDEQTNDCIYLNKDKLAEEANKYVKDMLQELKEKYGDDDIKYNRDDDSEDDSEDEYAERCKYHPVTASRIDRLRPGCTYLLGSYLFSLDHLISYHIYCFELVD